MMHQNSQAETATFCQLRRAAIRLDERECCDRGRTRYELARRLGTSESQLTKWLAPTSDRDMPESMDARWMKATGSTRLLKLLAEEVGAAVMEPRDALLLALVERFVADPSVAFVGEA